MKFKHIIYPCIAGVLLSAACEDESKDHLVDPLVYIVNNGIQTATYYDVENELDYNVYVYNSGFSAQTADVKIAPAPEALEAYNRKYGKSYKLLDEAYYAFIQKAGSLDNRRSTLVVRINCAATMSLPDAQNYIIPLQLTANGIQTNDQICTVLINPQMLETRVQVENTGVVESNLSSTNTLEFKAYTEFDNKWDSKFEFEYGDEVLAAYNAEHGTSYFPLPATAYTFHPAELTAQKNEAVSTFEIDKSELAANRYYALAVKLTGNSKFKIADDNLVIYHICLLPVADNTRKQWTLISCSSYSLRNGNFTPAEAIDGNNDSYWENRWADDGAGDTNTLPVNTVWDMGKSYYWCGTSITRRPGTYVTDLKSGYIEVSDDNKSWAVVQNFNFGDGNNKAVRQKFTIDGEKWLSGRYVRLVLAESNRSTSVSVAEFEPILAEIK